MRVLVTRPEPGSSETAARLAARGFEAVVLPLTETVPLAEAADAGPVDAVAVTSANAVRHAPRPLLDMLARAPVFAVGTRTGIAAREAGLNVVDEAAGDAEGLARAIAAAFPAPRAITVLCGRVRRDVLEGRLRDGGYRVRLIETYNTLPLDPDDAAIAAAFGEAGVSAVLVHSANGALQIGKLMSRPVLGTRLDHATFYCLSQRIADALPTIASERKKIAAQPAEEPLLALLDRHR
ncbi:uroporphyrinogen-III synthase [Nitratireductor pacificus]|uniref:Uroporphyrinogen-III synthase n=1 Tax=Nitratireductor pacificus pht-3B TaxID=391937 RepID=K2MNS3_9HYPH|nr:uroporphyrinogen-III synthase [Nitratireductor pacificus]EKF18927.1 uroporphyrinogen-III synthase [Nitratireductor pacificus pht-3B]